MLGNVGGGSFCWEAADFSISCLSVKEPRGRGHPASLGESSDLQPLAFLQLPPEFGGEGVDKAECHPTAGVVRLDGAPLQEQELPLVLSQVVSHPTPITPATPRDATRKFISHHMRLLLFFLGDPVPPPSTLVGLVL